MTLVGADLAAKVQVYAIHMRLSAANSKFYLTFFLHHLQSSQTSQSIDPGNPFQPYKIIPCEAVAHLSGAPL